MTTDLTAALGEAFVKACKEQFSQDQLAVIRRRNYRHAVARDGCCATHDFADANMIMDPCFTEIVGHELDASGEDEADHALWNGAWDYARKVFLDGTQDEQFWVMGQELEYENGQIAVVVWIAPQLTLVGGAIDGQFAVVLKGERFEMAYRDDDLQAEESWINPHDEEDEFATLDEALAELAVAKAEMQAAAPRTPKVILDEIEAELREGYPDLVDEDPAESYPASVWALAKELAGAVEG